MADNYIEVVWLAPTPKEWNYLDFSVSWDEVDLLSMSWNDFERGAYEAYRNDWSKLDVSAKNWNTIDSLLLTWNEFEKGGYNG